MIPMIALCLNVVGILLILVAFFKLKNTNGEINIDNEHNQDFIIKLKTATDEAETMVNELYEISNTIKQEIDDKYKELQYLYTLIDEKKQNLIYNGKNNADHKDDKDRDILTNIVYNKNLNAHHKEEKELLNLNSNIISSNIVSINNSDTLIENSFAFLNDKSARAILTDNDNLVVDKTDTTEKLETEKIETKKLEIEKLETEIDNIEKEITKTDLSDTELSYAEKSYTETKNLENKDFNIKEEAREIETDSNIDVDAIESYFQVSEILERYDSGETITQIARNMNIGIGEVQLVVDFSRRQVVLNG